MSGQPLRESDLTRRELHRRGSLVESQGSGRSAEDRASAVLSSSVTCFGAAVPRFDSAWPSPAKTCSPMHGSRSTVARSSVCPGSPRSRPNRPGCRHEHLGAGDVLAVRTPTRSELDLNLPPVPTASGTSTSAGGRTSMTLAAPPPGQPIASFVHDDVRWYTATVSEFRKISPPHELPGSSSSPLTYTTLEIRKRCYRARWRCSRFSSLER